ncbi:MAG: tetratricopeptide repeat protein, partial [Planctomycetota bacterium]
MKTKEINKVFYVIPFLATIFLSAEFVLAKSSAESFLSSPEVSKLEQEAQNCMNKKDYSKAEQIYKTIMTKWPKSNFAFEAQKNLVILYITTGSQEAPLAIGKFLANYNNHPRVWDAFLDIQFRYVRQGGFDNTMMSYQNILSKHSLEPHAMWAQAGLATLFISKDKGVEAEAVIEKLLKDYTNHPDIAGGINWIAGSYSRGSIVRVRARAIELYQHVLNKYPSGRWAMWTQSGLARCYILQNEDTKAESVIEKLLSDYSNHPDIDGGISNIADTYYDSEKTDRVIELHQHILSKYPSGRWAMWAQSGLARCYILQNEDTKAESAIEKLLSDYSNHPDIIRGISDIAGSCCDSGKTNQAIVLYQHIISKYPSDDWAMWAKWDLARCYILRNEDAKAESVIEKLMLDYSNHPGIAEGIIGMVHNDYYSDDSGKTNQVIVLSQHILSKYPSDYWAMWAQCHLARCYILRNEDAKAESAIEKLMSDYSNHP